MSSSAFTSSSTPSIKSIDIVHINRVSNKQTLITARAFRKTYRPTHHAKKLAKRLNLTVNIEKARNLEQKQISSIPLPIIEVSPLPSRQQAPKPSAHELSRSVVGREREMKRMARPVLRCDIPQDVRSDGRTRSSAASSASSNRNSGSASSAQAPRVLRGRNIPWVGPTSYWSPSSAASSNGSERRYSFDSIDELSLPSSIEYETDESSPYDAVDNSNSRNQVVQRVPLQIDLGSSGFGSCPVNDNSPSSSSSSGPVTPEDQESVQPKLVIRVKRSMPSSSDDEETTEKRPKFGRKSFVTRAKRTVKTSIHDSKPQI